MRRFVPSAGLPAVLAAAALAAAPAAPARALAPDDRAPTMGALVHTSLDVHIDRAPARVALEALARATAVPIVARFATDRQPEGLDPEAPITIRLERASARHVLEAILEQCEEFEPCTWQLRRGFVEVGPKSRLAAPAACETRVYPIRDLMLDTPYFVGPRLSSIGRRHGGTSAASLGNLLCAAPPAAGSFEDMPYADAVIGEPAPLRADGVGDAQVARKRPEEKAQEIVRTIVEMVEPGNWDDGEDDGGDHGPLAPPGGKIARLRLLGDRLVVHAPDFVHRQLAAPPAAPPPPLTDQERADRAALASAEGVTIVLRPPAPRGRTGTRR